MVRAQKFKSGDATAARSDSEREAFEKIDGELRDDADFALHMLRTYDKSFRFYADVANAGNRSTSSSYFMKTPCLDLTIRVRTLLTWRSSIAI